MFLKRNTNRFVFCKSAVKLSRISAVFLLVILITASLGFSQEKRPLELEDYAQWMSISKEKLSDNGEWLVYQIDPQYGDGKVIVRNLKNDTEYSVDRGMKPQFANDGKIIVFMIESPKDENNKKDKKIKSKLGIMDLSSGEVNETDSVSGFKVSDNGRWLAYDLFQPESDEKKDEKDEKSKENGTRTVLVNLRNDAEIPYEDVKDYSFEEESRYFTYTVISEEGTNDGIYVRELDNGEDFTLLSGTGKYSGIKWNEESEILVFVSDRDDPDNENPSWKIYRWTPGANNASVLVDPSGTRDFPSGKKISKEPSLEWAENSKALFFDISDIPEPADTTVKKEDLPDVDIWHWKDVLLQTQQHNRIKDLENKTYRTVYQFDSRRAVKLADEELEEVNIAPNYALAFGEYSKEYEELQPWNSTWSDIYLINVTDGARTLIIEKHRGRLNWSPGSKYLYWFKDENWFIYSIETGTVTNITESIDVELWDTLVDRPVWYNRPWGTPGWNKDDEGMIIYDRYDIWYAPVDGKDPQNLTGGEGRRRNAEFRYVTLDREEEFIDIEEPMLLSFLDNRTKSEGYYRLRNGSRNPVKLIEVPKQLSQPAKAEDADVQMFTMESFTEFSDLHISNTKFENIRKVTNANPQQEEFKWGSVQMIEYSSADGKPLQGVLYLPADYEEGKRYPLILYIYEIMTDRFHTYFPPIANHRFNATEYTSHGYACLYPDIVYDKGLPGPSSVKCLVPAVQKVIDMGIANPDKIGLQGHSWGGYEAAYIPTQTNIFTAICSGAPVSNMTSAYGGIRWGSGNPRTFQYETGQSRIGGTLWEKPELYIENSPLFFADRVQTPILIHHGDEDGAVPWYQSIEYFLALRRLDKPVWFLQYNDEPHHLQKKKNKYDWTIKMFEFFEHYLMDKPMPEWMETGVPATQKGRK